MKLSIDFETRSTLNLPDTGVYPYAEHPDTDIWWMGWAFDDELVELWRPGDPLPETVMMAVEEGVELRAWNAQFERIIWREIMFKRYGAPEPELEQWHDTAAEAAAMGLPRSLKVAGRVLGLDLQKDDEGRRLMLQMAKPRRPRKGEDPDALLWWDDEERVERLGRYCQRDVEVERGIARYTRPLSEEEREVYLLDQRINDRGVLIDVGLVDGARRLMERATEEANEELAELTGGDVTAVTRRDDLLRWLQHEGLAIKDLQKATLRDILEGEETLEPQVQRAIEIRSATAKTSTAKLEKMVTARSSDDRARGLTLYHGAATGRWSGKLIQPQNFPRGEVGDIEYFLPLIREGDYEGIEMLEPVPAVIATALRPMLIAAPDHRFIAADYAQIEARVLNWLAEQDDVLGMFARGEPIYETTAALIYEVPVEEIEKPSERRTVGKNTELGCGFQMGAKTYCSQAKMQSGLDLPPELCERAVEVYRASHPRVQAFWYEIQHAVMTAVRHPGKVVPVGRRGMIKYVVRGNFLWSVLPSGRPLAYARPKIVGRKTPRGEVRPAVEVSAINTYTRRWGRQALYGGLLTENVVQAMARDIMAAGMLRVERAEYPVVLTVHDEVLAEVPDWHGSVDHYVALLEERPEWAQDLPVAAEGWEGGRYRK